MYQEGAGMIPPTGMQYAPNNIPNNKNTRDSSDDSETRAD